MKKEEFEKRELEDSVFLLIMFFCGNILVFYFFMISGFNKFSVAFQGFSYFWTLLISLLGIGLRKELKKCKLIKYLVLLDFITTTTISMAIFNIQNSFSNTLKTEEIVTTHTYKVEDIKVERGEHSFYSEVIYKVTYEKDGKLKTVTISEEEGKEYKDYNRHKPTYKLEVTEYSYTKEFKKKYPDFEGRMSKQKLILERSNE